MRLLTVLLGVVLLLTGCATANPGTKRATFLEDLRACEGSVAGYVVAAITLPIFLDPKMVLSDATRECLADHGWPR